MINTTLISLSLDIFVINAFSMQQIKEVELLHWYIFAYLHIWNVRRGLKVNEVNCFIQASGCTSSFSQCDLLVLWIMPLTLFLRKPVHFNETFYWLNPSLFKKKSYFTTTFYKPIIFYNRQIKHSKYGNKYKQTTAH